MGDRGRKEGVPLCGRNIGRSSGIEGGRYRGQGGTRRGCHLLGAAEERPPVFFFFVLLGALTCRRWQWRWRALAFSPFPLRLSPGCGCHDDGRSCLCGTISKRRQKSNGDLLQKMTTLPSCFHDVLNFPKRPAPASTQISSHCLTKTGTRYYLASTHRMFC